MRTSPEIRDLGLLSSETRIIDALRDIAGVFGKTISVSAMPEAVSSEPDESLFLIHFDQTRDAIVAAKAMNCYLYGFSTLMVVIPRRREKQHE